MKDIAVEVSSPPTESGSAEGWMLKEAEVREALSRLERSLPSMAREAWVE
jgi:hypothetical protein